MGRAILFLACISMAHACAHDFAQVCDMIRRQDYIADIPLTIRYGINSAGNTLLHYAVSYRHISAIRYLLNAGLSPNVINNDCHSPFHIAILNDDTETVDMLLRNGANLRIAMPNGDLPIHYIVQREQTDLIACFARHYPSAMDTSQRVHRHGLEYETPLHRAIYTNAKASMITLRDHGANTAIIDRMHSTLLHYALNCGREDIARMLLYRRWLGTADGTGQLPIHRAVRKKLSHIVERILEMDHHCITQRTQLDHNTPLHITQDPEMTLFMLSYNPPLTTRNRHLETPLVHHVSQYMHAVHQSEEYPRDRERIVCILLEHGALAYNLPDNVYIQHLCNRAHNHHVPLSYKDMITMLAGAVCVHPHYIPNSDADAEYYYLPFYNSIRLPYDKRNKQRALITHSMYHYTSPSFAITRYYDHESLIQHDNSNTYYGTYFPRYISQARQNKELEKFQKLRYLDDIDVYLSQ